MTDVLTAYAITVGFAVVGAILGWALNYTIAIDSNGRTPSYVDKCFRDARQCLPFIPLAWAWPYLVARALFRAIRRTFEEAA